jgi:hypothetical protein
MLPAASFSKIARRVGSAKARKKSFSIMRTHKGVLMRFASYSRQLFVATEILSSTMDLSASSDGVLQSYAVCAGAESRLPLFGKHTQLRRDETRESSRRLRSERWKASLRASFKETTG